MTGVPTSLVTEPEALPWAGGAYSIKRHGTSLTNCASEPVQTPGCIQAHGALLVVRVADLMILQVSENSAHFFGEPPLALAGRPASSVVGQANHAQLLQLLPGLTLEQNPRHLFTLPARQAVAALDVRAHTMDGVLILEFEATGRSESPASTDYFTMVKSAIGQLQSASSLRDFCQRVTREVRTLTGLDRVMVYRFHADQHGEVFAESRRDDLTPWLGLHYPEGDIPKPARDIFKRIWIRPLPDAASPLVELSPLVNPDTGRPLNMTHCALRGASIMYTEYLANMGVAASLTLSILVKGELWGLIACHHYTVTHFSHQVRDACEVLAQVASLQLKSAEQNEQMAYRLRLESVHQQLVARAALQGDLMALSDQEPSLMDAMDSSGSALYHLDRWWCAGVTPDTDALDALALWLNERPELNSGTRAVFATDSLSRDFTGGAAIAMVASGVLAVRISRLRQDLIIWFRPQTLQTVNWAGDPSAKPLVMGPHGARLTPRGSFEVFVESVRARSLPWSSMEVESALRLAVLILELVVSRADRLSHLNIELTRSNEELDAFAYVASHDLKEPLRGIHRYAHQLLESAKTLDIENRTRLESLMRLTLRMDNLLDSLLHFSRVGRIALEFEPVDLNVLVEEALEMAGVRSRQGTCAIVIPRRFDMARCGPVRVREIYTNLISNALKYTRQVCPRIELGYYAPGETSEITGFPPQATGHVIYYVRDDGIGIDARHFDQIWRMFKRLHSPGEFGGGVGAGLTVVKKVVERHGGCMWLESALEVGSTFYFTLPVPVPPVQEALP